MNAPDDHDARAAFEQLYAATHADLLRYLLRRTLSAHDAADLLAETYLIAWGKLDELPPGDQARLWLFGVARNLLRGQARRRRADARLIERLAQQLDRAREPDAALAAVQAERRSELDAALATLPAIEREILTLTAWEGLTPTEIAAVTGSNANIVRVRLHRARAHLRRRIGPRGGRGAAPDAGRPGDPLGTYAARHPPPRGMPSG